MLARHDLHFGHLHVVDVVAACGVEVDGLAEELHDAAYHDATERSARLPATLLAMRRQIETYIVETRESIWNLRSASLDRDDLVTQTMAAPVRVAVDVRQGVAQAGQPRGQPETERRIIARGPLRLAPEVPEWDGSAIAGLN